MTPARKGQARRSQFKKNSDTRVVNRRRRAIALLHQLKKSIDDIALGEIPESLVNDLEHVVDNFTQQLVSNRKGGLLDNELLCQPDNRDIKDLCSQPPTNQSRRALRLEHHIYPRAGRSSVNRVREQYFMPVPSVDEEEQCERSQRTEEANFRKARIKARDLAVAEGCGLWVGLTVDDLHHGELTPEYLSKYLHRLSRKYRRLTGKHLHYVAVIGSHGRGPHVHALLSQDIDPDIVRDLWHLGDVDEITVIPQDMIEEKINYMGNNIIDHRISRHRFFRSRGSVNNKIVIPVDSFEDARNSLFDYTNPEYPRVVSAQPFGDNPRIAFRFKPVQDLGDG